MGSVGPCLPMRCSTAPKGRSAWHDVAPLSASPGHAACRSMSLRSCGPSAGRWMRHSIGGTRSSSRHARLAARDYRGGRPSYLCGTGCTWISKLKLKVLLL